jgi:hypothetical protein
MSSKIRDREIKMMLGFPTQSAVFSSPYKIIRYKAKRNCEMRMKYSKQFGVQYGLTSNSRATKNSSGCVMRKQTTSSSKSQLSNENKRVLTQYQIENVAIKEFMKWYDSQ